MGEFEYGSGPGYGNKSAVTNEVDTSDVRFGTHSNTDSYRNATDYGSGTTSGAGYGNKSTNPGDVDTSSTKLGLTHTDSYNNMTEYGSGTTGGAGGGLEIEADDKARIGNKMSSMDKQDSTAGILMEKIGGMVRNEGMIEKGHAKREAAGCSGDN